MKLRFGILWFTAFFLVSGCATVPMTPAADSALKARWPSGYPLESWYAPNLMPSTEEAITTIKNLRSRLLIENINPYYLAVDKCSFRIRLIRPPMEPYRMRFPLRMRLRAGSDHDFAYGISCGYNTWWEDQFQLERLIVIPFKDVKDLWIRNGKVFIGVERGEEIEIKTYSENDTKVLLDATYTLCSSAGFKPKGRLGLKLTNLTMAQANELGLSSGILVDGITLGGPAARAGIKFLDVILEVNGASVADTRQFLKLVRVIPFDAKTLISMKVLRWSDYQENTEVPKGFIYIRNLKHLETNQQKKIEVKWE